MTRSLTYYLPHGGSPTPKIAVVLLVEDTKVARGVAIRSHLDNFNRKRGRAIAMGRAKKALLKKKTCKNNEVRRPWIRAITEFKSKCSFMPMLTDYERTLLDET